MSNFSELFVRDLPDLIQRYLPKVTQIPLQQGIRWRPSWKALPNYAVRRVLGMEASPYVYLPLELKAFGSNLRFIHSRGDQMSPLMLSLERIRYAFDARNEAECFNDLTIMESRPSKANVECEEAIRPMCRFGRLGQSCEGRAKRRIFAIGNFVNQCLLKPVHDWLMSVLWLLPMDGSFNQGKPLRRLVGSSYMASIDLSVATDRFPLRLMYHCMATMFGDSYASSVVNSTLAINLFEVPFAGRKPAGMDPLSALGHQNTVCFVVCQPLGYQLLSSSVICTGVMLSFCF